MSTACELLSTIEASFPLRSEPHTWRRKVRWPMKDKQVLLQVKEQLQSTKHAARDRGNGTVVSSTECSKLERSRFAMTMLTGPRRVSQTIYVMIRVVCY